MPLTVLDRAGDMLDATVCSDEEWASVYKPAEPAGLVCRDCASPMHAKVSSQRLRFFAHARKASTCPSEGESPEHLALKRVIAGLIRDHGSTAILEAFPAPGDTGGWRADVLGVAPSGRRVAFEVQLAAMTVEEGEARTAKYRADGIDVLWVSTRQSRWMTRLPSAHLTDAGDGVFVVDRGLAKFIPPLSWRRPPAPVPADRVVTGMLDGTIVPVEQDWFTEEYSGKQHDIDDAVVLVPAVEARRAVVERDEWRRRQDAEHARDQAEQQRYSQHLTALRGRQGRMLRAALADAQAAIPAGHGLWLGVPPTWWNTATPPPQDIAAGNASTGFGLAVWTGRNASALSLWAVVCPVANRCDTGLGHSWRNRRVRVYVETDAEAARLGTALQWQPSAFHRPAR